MQPGERAGISGSYGFLTGEAGYDLGTKKPQFNVGLRLPFQKGGFEDLFKTNYKQNIEDVFVSKFKSQKEKPSWKLKKGVRRVESSDGTYMMNPNSTATGLYGQLFSEIEDLDIMKGISRERFAADTTLQNQIFDMRWRGELPGIPGMKENALRYRRVFPEETKGYTLEELAAISNLTGREGGNEYFLSIRNNTPFELPGINKTPEE